MDLFVLNRFDLRQDLGQKGETVPYRVDYDASLHCVVTTLSGDLDSEVVSGFFDEVGRVALENQCPRVLSDLREATIAAPLSDIYQMSETLRERNVPASFRRAIVVARDHQGYQFWENLNVNRGHRHVRIFEDYDEAKRWVLQGADEASQTSD